MDLTMIWTGLCFCERKVKSCLNNDGDAYDGL